MRPSAAVNTILGATATTASTPGSASAYSHACTAPQAGACEGASVQSSVQVPYLVSKDGRVYTHTHRIVEVEFEGPMCAGQYGCIGDSSFIESSEFGVNGDCEILRTPKRPQGSGASQSYKCSPVFLDCREPCDSTAGGGGSAKGPLKDP